jgi:hypothetical protein
MAAGLHSNRLEALNKSSGHPTPTTRRMHGKPKEGEATVRDRVLDSAQDLLLGESYQSLETGQPHHTIVRSDLPGPVHLPEVARSKPNDLLDVNLVSRERYADAPIAHLLIYLRHVTALSAECYAVELQEAKPTVRSNGWCGGCSPIDLSSVPDLAHMNFGELVVNRIRDAIDPDPHPK